MSIKILAKSFSEHRTIENTTVTTSYQMTWEDYYNGIGDLIDVHKNLIAANFRLPWEGDHFSTYYNTTYLNDIVLTDISMEPTQGIVNPFDLSGQDLDKEVIVIYTWSDEGRQDRPRGDEASSWLIRFDTTLESKSLGTYRSTVAGARDPDGVLRTWANQYLTQFNPNMLMLDDNNEEVDYGPYNDGEESRQQKYAEFVANDIPEMEYRIPHTTVTLTAYSNFLIGKTIADNLGSINSVDFLGPIFSKKEEALLAKNKLPGYSSNDWLDGDDSGKWLFIDEETEDMGSYFQHDFTFEYNPNRWNWYSDELTSLDVFIYPSINFGNVLLAGMDKVLPNSRGSR